MTTVRKILSLMILLGILLSVVSISVVSAQETELPEKYDSRDYGYITSVKNQQGYGTCWAHGIIAACEASLIKNNGFSQDLDLSEFHLAYCATHQMHDLLGLFDSEVTISPGKHFMNNGYYPELAAVTLANQNGVVLDTAHYKQFSSERFELSGLNQATISSPALQYGLNTAWLTNYYVIPSKQTDTVKEYLLRFGGCVMTTYSDHIDEAKHVFYTSPDDGNAVSGHAMCIVGWDDTIPASELSVDGAQPESDGAFILKNSWGTNNGVDGYYYIPYTDKGLLNNTAIFFEFSNEEAYTYSYGYDDLQQSDWLKSGKYTDYVKGANAFTAVSDDETLEAVSFFSSGGSVDYEINVYTGISELPDDGALQATVKGSTAYEGYRTVELDHPVKLSKGERFSVVVTLHSDELPVLICDAPIDSEDIIAVKHRNRAESFLYKESAGWRDLIDMEDETTDMDGVQRIGNIRIKAFTNSPFAEPVIIPDDFVSYLDKTRQEWLEELSPILEAARLEEAEHFYNYRYSDISPLLECFFLAESILEYPDLFTAAEIGDLCIQIQQFLENLHFVDYTDLINQETYAAEHFRSLAIEWKTDPKMDRLPVYQEFAALGEKINSMARNFEIDSMNYTTLYHDLWERLLDVIRYLYETGSFDLGIQYYGDVDNDGKISILDATTLQQILASLREDDYFSHLNADVNANGKTDITDATEIQKKLANIIDHFSVYDYDFYVEDEYTDQTDKDILIEYLKAAIEERESWDHYEPSFIIESEEGFINEAVYHAAQRALKKADRLSSAEILYYARCLISN